MSAPARAIPEDAVGPAIGGAIGTAIGGLAGFGVVLFMLDRGESIATLAGVDDTSARFIVDVFGVPSVTTLAGAALGAFIASAIAGDWCSPATVLSPVGAGGIGAACATPGCLLAVQSFEQADATSNCADACANAAVGVFFAATAIGSFCVGAPVGGAIGGGAGGLAAGGLREVPPAEPAPAPPPADPPAPAAPEAPPTPVEVPPELEAPPPSLAPPEEGSAAPSLAQR